MSRLAITKIRYQSMGILKGGAIPPSALDGRVESGRLSSVESRFSANSRQPHHARLSANHLLGMDRSANERTQPPATAVRQVRLSQGPCAEGRQPLESREKQVVIDQHQRIPTITSGTATPRGSTMTSSPSSG